VTIRYDPGAPTFERLSAFFDGIDRELEQRRTIAAPVQIIERGDIER
jgi:hypothetical protein